jgi:hypothetical protein
MVKERMGIITRDEQTGNPFELETETLWDIAAATFSVLFLCALFFVFAWALFDLYHGQNQMLQYLFSKDMTYPDSPLSQLIAYAVIGGGLGAIVNGFRSIVSWHAERRAFSWRFLWKYLTLPPLGAVAAAMVYAFVYAGVAFLGGSFPDGQNSANQVLVAFGIGVLAGYGSPKGFKWLDVHVNRTFGVAPAEINMRDLQRTSQDAAGTAGKEADLKPGKANYKGDGSDADNGNGIDQKPEPSSIFSRRESVDGTTGTRAEPTQQ